MAGVTPTSADDQVRARIALIEGLTDRERPPALLPSAPPTAGEWQRSWMLVGFASAGPGVRLRRLEKRHKVAEGSKKWFRVHDTYVVEFAPGQNDVVILAVTVGIDMM